MTSETLVPVPRDRPADKAQRAAGDDSLQAMIIAAGVGWSAMFVVVGLSYDLQMYADGSVFSYAVAVQDAWAIHWHNIAGRMFVYLFCLLPAEAYVALSGSAVGGIAVYGLLHFSAQSFGLSATFLCDRSRGRSIFRHACLSTACACPLVFGFPTEMWMAHAVFWPAFAACRHVGRGPAGFAAVFIWLLALAFTHEGGLLLAILIIGLLLPRGFRDPAVTRAATCMAAVVAIWAGVRLVVRPDDYIASVLTRAGINFFNVDILTGDLILLLLATLAGYGLIVLALQRVTPAGAAGWAASAVIVALAVYWTVFDHSLHADNRYYLRTVLLIATGGFALLAAAELLAKDGHLTMPAHVLWRRICLAAAIPQGRILAGAVMLVMLVHSVETVKFITGWTAYKAAVRALATGTTSDPALGDARFVSAQRVGTDLNRMSWSSTTPYLSILVAPRLIPRHLVVDPEANYFWLSCKTAEANLMADRAVPAQARELIRRLACLHR